MDPHDLPSRVKAVLKNPWKSVLRTFHSTIRNLTNWMNHCWSYNVSNKSLGSASLSCGSGFGSSISLQCGSGSSFSAFHLDTKPDPASKNNVNPCGSGSETLATRDKIAESGHLWNVLQTKRNNRRKQREKPCAWEGAEYLKLRGPTWPSRPSWQHSAAGAWPDCAGSVVEPPGSAVPH